ncbi:MAG TPA: hypothetical protein VFV10_17475, partial [Gammaproteobacteria bacterium]|nr:hypothetical protein [Gammaproteobacteria bacterium]
MQTLKNRSASWAIAAGIALLALCLFWSTRITEQSIDKDGAQNLTLAFNLLHHGVASLDGAAPYGPSMYREPLPVVTTAIAMAATEAVLGPAPLDDYQSGTRAMLVKRQNVVWAALLVVSTFWAACLLTSSRILGVLAASLVCFDSVPLAASGIDAIGLDSLATDLPAAALLMGGSALLLAAWRTRRLSCFVLAGVCIGLLALTKAAFLYVFAGVVVVLAGCEALKAGTVAFGPPLVRLAALAAAFAAVVLPWMLRNYFELGQFQLTERAGVVLLVRAMQDGMTAEEYRGAFFAWAPATLQPVVGRMLGFSRADLRRGARLQRLNREHDSGFYAEDLAAESGGKPENAITYYRKARAERVRLERLAKASGQSDAGIDRLLRERALALIEQRPLRHFAMTPL